MRINTLDFFKLLSNFEEETILVKNDKIISHGNILDMILECANKGIPTKGLKLYTNNKLSSDDLNLLAKTGIEEVKKETNKVIIYLNLDRISTYSNDYTDFIKLKKHFIRLGYNGLSLRLSDKVTREFFGLVLLVDAELMPKFDFDIGDVDIDGSVKFLTSEQFENIKLGNLLIDRYIKDIDLF